ncbi:MAG: hypothetical protein LBT47_11475 [Deltaproteobacteria bacterium]|jgi:ADP-heptose:LPS heptosyltransferase|nr:hypothetical protein [Deltaproteobacteria bacterium]
MTILLLEPFKLGDFIQSTALIKELKTNYPGHRLVLAALRPEVALAAAHCGLIDETIALTQDNWERGDAAKLPNCELLINLSSAPEALILAQNIKAQEKLGPAASLNGSILPPPQRLAKAVMMVNRRLGRFNLVDLWRLLSPIKAAARPQLFWPLRGPQMAAEPAWPEEFDVLVKARSQASTGLSCQNPGPESRALFKAGGDAIANHQTRVPSSPFRRPAVEINQPAGPNDLAGKNYNFGSRPLVGLHLGCGHHLRRWPTENFVQAARLIGPTDLVLLGGPSEKALAKRFISLAGPKKSDGPSLTDLSGRTSLASLGRVLAQLDLLISADTGVMHLAAAVGTPVVAVFGGPALAGETGPYSGQAAIIQGFGPCSPCREGCGCRQATCPYLPPVAPVAQMAQWLLDRSERLICDENEDLINNLKISPQPDSGGIWSSPGRRPSYRIYLPSQDAFGQNLYTQLPDDDEILAQAIRLAAISTLGLADNSLKTAGPAVDASGRGLRAPAPDRTNELMETISKVANLAFDEPQKQKFFIQTAQSALAA